MTARRGSSPFVQTHIIGGNGGSWFNFHAENGAMLEKIGVWVGGWQVKGVKVWLTNGAVQQYGTPRGPYSQFSFQPGELITSMSLWGNGAGTRLGAIKFKTNKSREFFASMNEWGLKQEYPIDVGSGICVGVMGKAGEDIDCMGFVFVKPIRHSVMTDMEYPTIGLEDLQVQMSNIKSTTYKNDLNSEQSFTLEASSEITTKESWSVTTAIESAYHVTVKAGIPEITEVEAGWKLKVSGQRTYEMENTEKKTEKWTFPFTVPANSKLQAKLSMGRADIDLPYNATVEITTTDGSVLTYDVRGIYNGIEYTKAIFSASLVE